MTWRLTKASRKNSFDRSCAKSCGGVSKLSCPYRETTCVSSWQAFSLAALRFGTSLPGRARCARGHSVLDNCGPSALTRWWADRDFIAMHSLNAAFQTSCWTANSVISTEDWRTGGLNTFHRLIRSRRGSPIA